MVNPADLPYVAGPAVVLILSKGSKSMVIQLIEEVESFLTLRWLPAVKGEAGFQIAIVVA